MNKTIRNLAIAALFIFPGLSGFPQEVQQDETVTNCVPGFYYTLYGAAGVRALPTTETIYGSVLCGTDEEVRFSGVVKPSDAAGFFTTGVSATKGK